MSRMAPAAGPSGRRFALVPAVGQQDAHVLDRRDQVILDLLAPKPPPACPFEVVVVGGIGKALLHELLAALAIPSRPAAVGLLSCYIQ